MDYLDWRGDLTFSQSEFNEVDNLILAQFSYVNFEDIAPDINSEGSISVKEVYEKFFKKYSDKEINHTGPVIKTAVELMIKMAQCRRFANARLSRYVNRIDYKEEKQFSAVNIHLEDDTVYVAYRGTDDTIVGWKEDFNMSFMTIVPSQIEAVLYLEETAVKHNKKMRIGGHSKGGNLAVYAAVKCSSAVKENIIEVYNNDGPGFEKEMILSLEYQNMKSRIKTIVPQSSIVGMLLEHEEDYIIVKSLQKHMMQHFAMSWEVLGKHFVYVDCITEESKMIDKILKTWVDKMTVEEREQFVDSLFYIFDQTDVKNIGDLVQNKWRKVTEIRKVIRSMPPENKDAIYKTIKLLLQEGSRLYKYRSKQA
jgi:hypothetical protein